MVVSGQEISNDIYGNSSTGFRKDMKGSLHYRDSLPLSLLCYKVLRR
jgi:hypothetical protein